MANLNIKLVKSLNGRLEKHIATANSLGLRKIGDTTVQPDNAQTQRQDRQDRLSAAGHRSRIRRCESMKLNELSPAAGSTKEAYRKGRGQRLRQRQDCRPWSQGPEGPLRRRYPHRL